MRFIDSLAGEAALNETERRVAFAAGVRSPEDLDSLLRAFPSIARLGVRIPNVSNAIAMRLSAAYRSSAAAAGERPGLVGYGASAPEGAYFAPGREAPAPTEPPPPGPDLPAETVHDLRAVCGPWPVRHQGGRGTCVAFGAVACLEHALCRETGTLPDMSEQFLYWAIKTDPAEPRPHQDGTWLTFAQAAMARNGVCIETDCPYLPQAQVPVCGPTPTGTARTNALAFRRTTTVHQQNPPAAAARVRQILASGRPVAVSLPVFSDPQNPGGADNWSTGVGWDYGRVLNPPPTSVVTSGHCVCVTGFVSDVTEPKGGYFIFRNSWGTRWAQYAPAPGNSYAPAQGYGEVSAAYVDAYCWELFAV
jgi:hypothetical protein